MHDRYLITGIGEQDNLIVNFDKKEVERRMDYIQNDLQMKINEITRKFSEWVDNTIYELMNMVSAKDLYDLQNKGYEIKVEYIAGTSDKTIKLVDLLTGELIHGYTIKIETSFKSHDNFVHSSEMKVTREPILYHGGK
jgi:CheY-specific phosphatase CheX